MSVPERAAKAYKPDETARMIVLSLARYYAHINPSHLPDLLQVGFIAEWEASQTYKPERACSFAVYARPFIKGAMRHYLRDYARMVRISAYAQERGFSGIPVLSFSDEEKSSLFVKPDFAPSLIHALSTPELEESEEDEEDEEDEEPDTHAPVLALKTLPLKPDATPREIEVLALLSDGLTAVEVGESLGLTANAVRAYVNRLYKRWNVNCLVSAYKEALRKKILDPPT